MVSPETVMYHGTSLPSWKRRMPGEQLLYLVANLKDAAIYAYEEAARDEGKGKKPQPVVFATTIKLLEKEGLSPEPDWGWAGATEETTWLESFKEVGSFSVRGNVEAAKKHFRRVPRKEWA